MCHQIFSLHVFNSIQDLHKVVQDLHKHVNLFTDFKGSLKNRETISSGTWRLTFRFVGGIDISNFWMFVYVESRRRECKRRLEMRFLCKINAADSLFISGLNRFFVHINIINLFLILIKYWHVLILIIFFM